MDDGLALEALLELSQNLREGEVVTRSDEKNFPLLDEPTVLSAVEAVTFIIEKKHKLRNHTIDLLRKWSDVRENGLSDHWTWTGSRLSRLDTLDCLLATYEALLDEKSFQSKWQCLELHQKQALCHAMIRSASECERAKKLTMRLFEFIIKQPVSITDHQNFLEEIWNFQALLELTTKQIELLVQNAPHGLEKQLLKIARDCIKKDSYEPDIWLQTESAHLIKTCSSSPVVFQVTTSILMQLVLKSQAHQTIVELLTDFAAKCAPTGRESIRLYPAKCQMALALLSVSPEALDDKNYVDFIVTALRALQPVTAKLLLILNPKWIPVIVDEL